MGDVAHCVMGYHWPNSVANVVPTKKEAWRRGHCSPHYAQTATAGPFFLSLQILSLQKPPPAEPERNFHLPLMNQAVQRLNEKSWSTGQVKLLRMSDDIQRFSFIIVVSTYRHIIVA